MNHDFCNNGPDPLILGSGSGRAHCQYTALRRKLLKSRASGLLTSTGLTNGMYIPFQIMGVKGYIGRINMGLWGACMDII